MLCQRTFGKVPQRLRDKLSICVEILHTLGDNRRATPSTYTFLILPPPGGGSMIVPRRHHRPLAPMDYSGRLCRRWVALEDLLGHLALVHIFEQDHRQSLGPQNDWLRL